MINLVRAKKLADILQVHESTVWRWSDIGKIPKPTKIGGRVSVWDADAVVAKLFNQ